MSHYPDQSKSVCSYWWIAVFLLAAFLWSFDIRRPVDLPNWHEFDYSSIARNFVREGNNILLPRIDWRGDGPGFTEMEFPIIPWITAQLFLVFGTHAVIARILSLAFTLSSLWVFRRIARKLLPESAALIAALFLVVSHVIIIVATAILPESLMLLCYLLAVYYFLDWYESKSWLSYTLAICSFAGAILIKSPAAHLAIFFFIWALLKDGLSAFRRPSLYVFAALSFAPALLWYAYAASLWHQYHNSMGVSNEDHWLGLDILRRPKVIANLIAIDFIYIFGGGGLLVVAGAIVSGKLKSAVNRVAVSWCAAVAIYLIVIIRTAGANWASYYHVVALPPIALLFGSGVYQAGMYGSISWSRMMLWISVPASLIIAGLFWIGRKDMSHAPAVLRDLAVTQSGLPTLLVLGVLSFGVTVLCFSLLNESPRGAESTSSAGQPAFIKMLAVIGCFTYFFVSIQLMLGTWRMFALRTPQFEAAACFRSSLSSQGLIVASGGICTDANGHRVANDAPNMFYWLDRKGFSTCEGRETIAELAALKQRGAQYFIVEQASLQAQPGFAAELRRSYSLVAGCNAALLFRLDAGPRSHTQ